MELQIWTEHTPYEFRNVKASWPPAGSWTLGSAPPTPADLWARLRRAADWLNAHPEEIEARRGKWIAVSPEGIVDEDADLGLLTQRTDRLGADDIGFHYCPLPGAPAF